MPSIIRNGTPLQVSVDLDTRRLHRSRKNQKKSVVINIKTERTTIFEDPTGSRTLMDTNETSPPLRIQLTITGSQPRDIRHLLHNNLDNLRWLSRDLAPRISRAATEVSSAGGFVISVFVTLTYTVVVRSLLSEEESREEMLMNQLVQAGKIEGEDLNDLDREYESCSICLENFLAGSSFTFPTRMSCSHVFHEVCLLDWLKCENTCPLCRIVLYER